MPPKRVSKAKKEAETEPVISSSSDSDSDVAPIKSVITTASRVNNKRPTALVKFNSSDLNKNNNGLSDRLQLAQAINNLVFKGDAFTSALEQLH